MHGGRLIVARDDEARAPVALEVAGQRLDPRGEVARGGRGRRPWHAQGRGQRQREGTDEAGLQRQAVVGDRAGDRRCGLDHVEPVHLAAAARDPAPGGKLPRVAHRERAAAEHVGVERDDHLRLVEAVLRIGVLAEREEGSRAGVVAADWLPLVPDQGRQLRLQPADLAGQRR